MHLAHEFPDVAIPDRIRNDVDLIGGLADIGGRLRDIHSAPGLPSKLAIQQEGGLIWLIGPISSRWPTYFRHGIMPEVAGLPCRRHEVMPLG